MFFEDVSLSLSQMKNLKASVLQIKLILKYNLTNYELVESTHKFKHLFFLYLCSLFYMSLVKSDLTFHFFSPSLSLFLFGTTMLSHKSPFFPLLDALATFYFQASSLRKKMFARVCERKREGRWALICENVLTFVKKILLLTIERCHMDKRAFSPSLFVL